MKTGTGTSLASILALGLLLLLPGTERSVLSAQEVLQAESDFGVRTLYAPPEDGSSGRGSYPRVVRIEHHDGSRGHLLATFERSPHLAIYRSTDNGDTWAPFSEVEGLRWQPSFFELPQRVGEFEAGTILLAAMQTPPDRSSTSLQVFYSTDGGSSWEYLSTIEEGGRMVYNEEQRAGDTLEDPVWEPYLYLDAYDRLVAAYATEKRKADGYNQALAIRISEDGGRNWGEEQLIAAKRDMLTRPGMPLIERLPHGRYMLVYEIVGRAGYVLEPRTNPIFYKLSDDGVDFGDPEAEGRLVQDDRRQFASATPGLAWSPWGGPDGTLMVAGRGIFRNHEGETGGAIMINRDLGEEYWILLETPIEYEPGPGGYSQVMIPLGEGGREILHVVPVDGEIKYTKFHLPD